MKLTVKELLRIKPISRILKDAAVMEEAAEGGHGLRRSLRVWDLTALGIAAIIGAGIFATIGEVCFKGGPGVVLLFIFVGIACGFSALCYASFSSMIPIAGSAYTYSYASFGELIAWIIGWDLIIEYAIGNIAVAISWSGYFTNLLEGFGLQMAPWLTTDYLTASQAFADGATTTEAYLAYIHAPVVMGLKIMMDLPAFLVVVFVSFLTYIGIRETRNVSNFMVALKIGVILLVIFAGAFFVQPENWTPFLPNGMGGVLAGVSGVFFAYIGFDAISTTAEEANNPQRDLPKAMIYALIICTVLYIGIALIVTGIVPFTTLDGVDDPLAFIFNNTSASWISYVVSVSAIVAMAGVLLVFQLGQPRIWMSMSRDGLLPKKFAEVHPKFRTPSFSTLVTAALVAIPALFLNLSVVTDLTSIGTLFAFVLVCGGVLILDIKNPEAERRFKIPFVNSKFFFMAAWPLVIGALAIWNPESFGKLVPDSLSTFEHLIPTYLFFGVAIMLTVLSFSRKLSLIPVLGLLSCLYLMSEIETASWYRFMIWLAIGLVIYFGYSYRHSRLRLEADVATD